MDLTVDSIYAKANSTAILAINQRLKELESWTKRRCTELGMTRDARHAAAAADRWIIRLRIPFIAWRHNETKRRFLHMMTALALASDATLAPKAFAVARYYAANYAFEWVNSEITQVDRDGVAGIILAAGDSSFGDTANAGPMAYVQFHHDSLGVENVGKFGDLYAMGAALTQRGEFTSQHGEWRVQLGLDNLRPKRDGIIDKKALREASQAQRE